MCLLRGLRPSFAQKLHALVAVGQSPGLKTGGGGTSSRLRCEMVRGWRRRRRRCFAWQWADSVYAWSHGAGRPSNRGWMWRRPCPDAPWLIVLPRESLGRPVLSHWGAEAQGLKPFQEKVEWSPVSEWTLPETENGWKTKREEECDYWISQRINRVGKHTV